ncbi:diol dehydratase reactivase ATPase-like domain-containing protein [Longivirga aurantiaca]|uniref:Diol dehydratase reactivase ATPase-like domain-containing protein n=1 Tax=Longivirga aurantiaca TaxID=1837743 RepID=A0ABW1SZA5_9ACTN
MTRTVVAGVDVGNATTEVVLVDVSVVPPMPLVWERTPTRGRKGSAAAASAAAVVVRRLARKAGVEVTRVVVAPQRPVDSHTLVLPATPPDTGRLRVLGSGSATPGAPGAGVGRPVDLADEPGAVDGPVVLVARDPRGYRATSERIDVWQAAGADVVAVLLAGDEAVLVSRRISRPVPVVDQVDTDAALACSLVAVEVAEHGLAQLVDPVRVAALLDLDSAEHAAAEAAAASLRGLRDAAVGIGSPMPRSTADDADIAWARTAWGHRSSLHELAAAPQPRGAVVAVGLPTRGRLVEHVVDDAWAVDLDAVGASAAARPRSVNGRAVAIATLASASPDDDPAAVLAHALGVPVSRVSSEAHAARTGAMTTPSARPGALVIDLGGGTVDVVPDGEEARVVAGAGDLLTAAVAHVLDVPRGAAEWAKRGASSRLEGPHVLVGEDGERRFVETAVPADAVGSLVVPGPAGLLPFHRRLAPGEWRMLRQHLKRAVVGDNIARATSGMAAGVDVLLVGGPAGDSELLDLVVRALPGSTPGRADVAGALGHRWAVAYGLTVLDARGDALVVA